MIASLAQIAPLHDSSPSTEATFFYLFCGAVAFFVGLAVGVGSLIYLFRRHPPIEAEFPTKKEVEAKIGELRTELHREVGALAKQITALDLRNEQLSKAIFEKIDDIARSFDHGMREVHRALARLEGKP